jgi:hypothetical protein
MQLITQQEVMWYGIMTELGLRLTKVQYNGCSYGSWCNTYYNINTTTLGIHIEINRARVYHGRLYLAHFESPLPVSQWLAMGIHKTVFKRTLNVRFQKCATHREDSGVR